MHGSALSTLPISLKLQRRLPWLVYQCQLQPSYVSTLIAMVLLVTAKLGLIEPGCLQAPVASKATQRKLQASCSPPAVQSESTTSSSRSLPAQAERTTLTLPTALSLYELTDSKLFTDLQTDTRCLVTWNATKVVITFRGTASMKNARADLQVRCSAT